MSRSSASINYAAGSLFGNMWNIYLHGTAIISTFLLVAGLASAGSFNEAVNIVVDVYFMKLLPWPLDEIYLAETFYDLIISHVATISVGLLSATARYWANNPKY